MDIEIIRRICLARHLYELGQGSLKSDNDLYLFSGVNLLQDAVEAFLIAVADFVGASLDDKTHFDKYFVEINKSIAPRELPLKTRLLRLNKIRVNSKHHGIQPAKDECQRLAITVREFFDEVSSSVLGVNFSTVSTIDLLPQGETKEILIEAKSALEKKDYTSCAISCRKAIFLELEQWYDIAHFIDDAGPKNAFIMYSIKAPLYAKNKEYIDKNVNDPTDYIVYDHNTLDQELLKYSVDNTAFWNIWRLTPEVYRTKEKQWVVKHDFRKIDREILIDKIEYIFNTTVDIMLAIYTKKESVKTGVYQDYYIDLAQNEVPVYEKADSNSPLVCIIPKNMNRVNCKYHITGLKGDGPYWRVRNYKEEPIFSGFIHNDYVKKES